MLLTNLMHLFKHKKQKFIHSSAKNLLKTVLRNVVKAPLLDFVGSGIIDPLLPCNRQSSSQVIVGKACQDLDRLNKEGQGEIIKSVYDNCLAFYNIATKEIRERLFVKEKFLTLFNIFDPKFFFNHEDKEDRMDKSLLHVIFIARRIGGFNEEMLQKEWRCQDMDFSSEQRKQIMTLNFDNAWKTILASKDADGKFKYPMLTKLVNAIRALPNSNADSERVFSMLTNKKTEQTFSDTYSSIMFIQNKSEGERRNGSKYESWR